MTKMTDTAALAAIGAATRELRLPVVRKDAARARRGGQALASLISAISPRCSRPKSTSGLSAVACDGSQKPTSRGSSV